uniref:Uncharacterized protein n=1 Tax=Desulfatirhabdium butyrativorans TaxID=340467 RepID=A0A7C4MRS7_9BACT
MPDAASTERIAMYPLKRPDAVFRWLLRKSASRIPVFPHPTFLSEIPYCPFLQTSETTPHPLLISGSYLEWRGIPSDFVDTPSPASSLSSTGFERIVL